MANHPQPPTSSDIGGLCHPHWTSWPAPLPEGVRSALPSAWFACSAMLTLSALPVMQSLRLVLSGNDRSNCTPFFPPIAPVQGYCVTKTKQSGVAHSLGVYPFSILDFPIPSHPYIGLVSWDENPRWHILQIILNSYAHTVSVNGEFLAEELNPSWALPASQAWDKASPGAKQLLQKETTRGGWDFR